MSRTPDENIIQQLRQKICSGGFDKISFLPSERKLAEEYQVGRGVIRGALKVLCEEGLIYNVPRRGLRIKKKTEKRMKRIIVRLPTKVTAKAYEVMGLVSGICAGANDLFAEVILSTPPARLNLPELRDRYNANDIQGIVFLEGSGEIPFEEFVQAGIPCVIANLEDDEEVPGVRMDYRGIGRIAGKELIQRGYQKICVFSGPMDHFFYREIFAGFRGALAEENLVLPDSMHIVNDKLSSPQAIRDLLMLPPEERPEAIFTIRDYRAAQVYAVCEELSIRIPEDLGVISFDGITWPGAENAGLTTIIEDVTEIGRQAVFLLQKQFESGYDPVICMIGGQLSPGKSLRQKNGKSKIFLHTASQR